MSNRSKKIFLALSVVVPFLLYCTYYYGMMVKNAPYKFAEFQSLNFKYGLGDSLVNQYDSKTQIYQYINDRDSLVKVKVKLTKDDLLYLHRKAADLGFWNFPSDMEGVSAGNGGQVKSPHYFLQFNYERKTKHIDFDLDYAGNPKLTQAVKQLIEEVDKRIKEAEARKRL